MNSKNNNKKLIFLDLFLLLVFSFALGLSVSSVSNNNCNVYADDEIVYRAYLSNYEPIVSNIGYGTLKKDTNINGDLISFIVDGKRTYFYKGVLAHASSTLVYDIGENHNFDYFSSYIGIDASQGGKGNVKFSVYSSSDNINYETQLEPTVKTSSDEAIFIKFSVNNVRYLKFIFDSNGGNGNDHSALGDCLLYAEGYEYEIDDTIKPVSYFDDLLANKTTEDIINNYSLELMQRMLVEKVGYNDLKERFLSGDNEQDNRIMLNWLYNDETALKDFILGGTPNGGNYINSLNVLSKLYKYHSSDLSDTNDLFEPETGSTRKRGDVYRTMMISIALTHARGPYSWQNSSVASDPLERYEAFKFSYLVEDYHLRYDVFENLCVEEMRYLMSNRISNDEIYWLNAYATINCGRNGTSYPNVYSPHIHLKYGRDWNYAEKGYYKEENFEKYNQKYMLEKYGVGFSTSAKLWMVFEGSQICWGISYTGTCFTAAFGVPSHYVRQPDHAAFLVYNRNSDGRSVWSIDNNIFGWTKTWVNEDTVGNGNNRMMCDWGTNGQEQVKNYNATYILLAQASLDHLEQYEKAEQVLGLESLVQDKEQLYRDALNYMPYHFDAWFKLCKLYIQNNKSDAEIAKLAEEIANNMYCFPLPMHELLMLLKNELLSRNTDSSLIQMANIDNIDRIALQKATNATNDEFSKELTPQVDVCREEARYLLGLIESEKIATFSFDGENSNKLIFNSKYTNVRYKLSLDNGNT